ncbi:hypothetical protein GCM10023322_40930 [Rugosimonospora acidiphila]|uniref:AI-2E family transporter n=1 Tax=Rugosimonospora acidiphila TaxID=556531 RepID=A0ABP9RY34_9ACTN
MHSVRRRPRSLVPERREDGRSPLPLRWAVIMIAVGLVGFSVNSVAGLVPAITAAVAVAALLDQVLA